MPPWSSPRTVLFSITFICSFLGAVNDPVEIPHHQVNGMLNGTVLLPIRTIFTSDTIYRIEWEFQPQNGTRLNIAEFQGGALQRPNPNDRFGSRLKLVDGSLRIRNLEKEDSGLYIGRVKFRSAKVQEHSYHLEVYDSVPVPRILHQITSNSSVGCNVTLECWLSEKAGLNVSWRIGDDLRTLEGSSGWYQLSSDGWRLHVSIWSIETDSSFTCLVSSLVDQKNVSINLLSICSFEDNGPIRNRWWSFMAIVVLLFLPVFAIIWIRIKRKNRFTSKADPSTPRGTIPEHVYYENQSERNPAEMNNYQASDLMDQPMPELPVSHGHPQLLPLL